jgi:hypothetical protein
VVETRGPRTYLGRYDSEDDQGLHMLDVAIYEEPAEISKDEYIRKSAKFGIRSQHRHLIVPRPEVTRIRRLGEIA